MDIIPLTEEERRYLVLPGRADLTVGLVDDNIEQEEGAKTRQHCEKKRKRLIYLLCMVTHTNVENVSHGYEEDLFLFCGVAYGISFP